MPVPSPVTDAEAMARALWLVDNQLIDVRCQHFRDDFEALNVRLRAVGMPDERISARTVASLRKSRPGLWDNLDRLGQRLFSFRQGVPEPQSGALPRRLARIVDLDALICLHPRFTPPADECFDWPAIPVYNDDRTAPLLDAGSLDTHVHMAGCLPPLFYWVAMMGGELPFSVLSALPHAVRGYADEQAWRRAVARAMWLRLALAHGVQRSFAGRPEGRFPQLPHPDDRSWTEFAQAESETPVSQVRDAVLRLTVHFRHRRRPQPDDEDPPRSWVLFDPLRGDGEAPPRPHYAAGERRLLLDVRSILRLPMGSRKELAERARLEVRLLEYLRARNAFHYALAHDEGTSGLLRFAETMGRRGLLFRKRRRRRRHGRWQPRYRRAALGLERDRMAATLDGQLTEAYEPPFAGGHSRPPRRVEMRVSVPDSRYLLNTLRAWLGGIKDYIRTRPDDQARGEVCQIGLIFHFLKRGSGPWAEKRADHEARQLGHLLTSHPNLRPLIVGIDAAGDERRSPPRVFAPAFARLRELEQCCRPDPGVAGIKLGRTFHVGEDVEDLLTGLRHVDEAARLLLGDRGGRLGHALVLSEPPARFYERRGGQTEPLLGSHVLDLVWACGTFTEARDDAHVPWLRQRILELVEVGADKVGDCFLRMREPVAEQKLLGELGLPRRPCELKQPVTVTADDQWLALVGRLQHHLRRQLARRRLCIEANPTSNLIIGGYSRYDQLPCRTLVDDELAVSLGTDDPGLFMTSLPAEFAAMYEALSGEMSDRRVLQWLADRIADAERSTFLGPHVPTGADFVERGVRWFFRY